MFLKIFFRGNIRNEMFKPFDFIIQEAPSVHRRRIQSAPSKIAARRTAKVNGFINSVKTQNHIQPFASVTPVAPSPPSMIFRLNTIVLRHE